MAAKQTNELRMEYEAAPDGARLPPPVAAAGMNLSPLTLERWRSVGKGPKYQKIGGRVAYRKRDVELWVAMNAGVPA